MVEVLPEMAAELREALIRNGNIELASQVAEVCIVELCSCGDDFCSSFYTGPRPAGSWGAGHENVVPDMKTGTLVLDVVDGVVRYVEVLDRPDVHETLFEGR